MRPTVWPAHAAARLAANPPQPRDPPSRLEWTQQPGIGPGAEILGEHLAGRRIAELGCGAGHNTAHLAALGAIATGVDSCAGQIRRATIYYGHTPATFRHQTAHRYLTCDSQPLDAILSIFGAIGTAHPARLLAACTRRLARHGVLAFTLPHPQRNGTIPATRRTRRPVVLPDGHDRDHRPLGDQPRGLARHPDHRGPDGHRDPSPIRARRRPLADNAPAHRP